MDLEQLVRDLVRGKRFMNFVSWISLVGIVVWSGVLYLVHERVDRTNTRIELLHERIDWLVESTNRRVDLAHDRIDAVNNRVDNQCGVFE